METILQDIRYATRQLLKHPGFTLVAAMTLALGIGANTAIFSVVYGVLLRPLPYPKPDQVVGLAETYSGGHDEMGVTYPEFQFLAERANAFSGFAAAAEVGMTLTTGDAANHLHGMRVSRDYFRVLGVGPALGRGFAADEDQVNGPSVLVISHAVWESQFGGDRSVIGRTVQLDGKPATVIGVMPADFVPPATADAWSTLAQVGATVGSGENLAVIGRISPGLTVKHATQQMQVVFADFRAQFKGMGLPAQLRMDLVPYAEVMVTDVQEPVMILFGAIAFVLLIACANVASLVLGRAASRHRELAVRVALGATRRRIIAQMLTESVLLSLVGAALALGVAAWTLHAVLAFLPADLPRAAGVHIDGRAMLFAFGVASLTGVGFGLVPAWLTARADAHVTLKEASARTTGSAAQGRLRNVLVVAEVALSLILLAGAGLMIRTVANLVRTDPGFDLKHEISAEIWLTGSRYDTPTAVAGFYRDVIARTRALPGVTSAAVVEAGQPLERGGNIPVSRDSTRLKGGVDYRAVTPGYFRTLGVAVQQGRDFSDGDDAAGQPVVIVNEAFLRQKYLPDNALGQTLAVGGNGAPRAVVGVVGDVKSFIGFGAPPTVFIPSAQTPFSLTQLFNGWFPIHVIVRTAGDPAALIPAVTRAIHATDPQVPVGETRTLSSILDRSVSLQRFVMVLLTAFAALAIALAVVGMYGLISWFVARNTRDIGVRIALGAMPAQVVMLVLRRGMALTLIGGGIGLLGSLALTRLLSSLLFNVKPADIATLFLVTVFLNGIGALACYLPARRAARVDPIVALRAE